MKKTILPALAMLIVAAVMLSTASYAWFAMSTEVAVNNMHVSVKSDAANLVIAETAEAITGNSAYNTLKFDFDDIDAEEYLPTAFDATESDGSTAITSASFKKDVTWYTRTSDDPNQAVTDTSSAKEYIPYANIGDYALVKSFFVGVTAGSNDMYQLKAKATISNAASVNVLVVCTDLTTGFQNFTETVDNYNTAVELADVITAATPIQVDIYVYYNGNHDDINSVNLSAGSIKEAVVSVQFTATTTNPNP